MSPDPARPTRRLLVLGGASQPAGADVLAQTRARDVEVCLVDTPANLAAAPELVAAAAEVVPLDYTDAQACLRWAREHSRRQPFLGVYGFREPAAESVAEVAQALGLPGNPVEAVRRVRDKHSCRRGLAEHGFRQPVSALCAGQDEVLGFLRETGPGPWVIKPVGGWGSAGVSLLRDRADLDAAVRHLADGRAALSGELARQGIDHSPAGIAAAQILVEQFQTGQEFSAEAVMVGGRPVLLAITRKITTGPPYFIETGHTLSADLPDGCWTRVQQTLSAALPALGLRWGVMHVEFWLTGDEVVLGEVHVRPGGDYIHLMTQHVTDVELHGVIVDQLLNVTPDPAAWQVKRGAAVRFLLPPPGRVLSIDGWDEVRADPQFLTGRLTLHPGDRVRPLNSSADRSTLVVATAPTSAQAAREAARLIAGLRVQVHSEPCPQPRRHPAVLVKES